MPDPAAKRAPDVAGASGPRGVLWGTVLPVWAVAIICGVMVDLIMPESPFTWLAIALGLCTLVAFACQLTVPTIPGHISRLGWAVGGALVLLAHAGGVVLLLSAL